MKTIQPLPKEIKSWYPPVIANTLSGRYGILDGKWYTLNDSETLETIRSRWVRVDWKGNPYQVPVVEPRTQSKEFEIPSSDGKKMYIVTVSGSNATCTCTGYGFRSRCKHVDEIKKGL
jgi:hypothetical protein